MASPTSTDVYAYLENYGIANSNLTTTWIDARITNKIIPYLKKRLRIDFENEQTYSEYISGAGEAQIMLSRKPVNELVTLTYLGSELTGNLLTAVVLIQDEGIIVARNRNADDERFPAIFPRGTKNIYVQYKAGFDDFVNPQTNEDATDLKEAIVMIACIHALNLIGARTGGGSLSQQAWNRNFGERGKYNDIIRQLTAESNAILRNYYTSVVSA